jgi:hypothetical protein
MVATYILHCYTRKAVGGSLAVELRDRSTLNMSVNEYISALRNPLSLEIYTRDDEGPWRSQINHAS